MCLQKAGSLEVIKVEPLRNLPLIKDLIVDMDPLVDKMKHYSNWVDSIMPEAQMGKKEFLISEEEFLRYDKATDCILCASCVSECSILRANKEYVSPAVLLKSYRMNVDSRDSIHDHASCRTGQGSWSLGLYTLLSLSGIMCEKHSDHGCHSWHP